MDGKSDFAAVLDELIRQRDEVLQPQVSGIDYLNVVEELHSGRIQFAGDQIELVYREQTESPLFVDAPPVAMAAPLPSISPADIRRELGLDKGRTDADLDAARRRFAFANHPDRTEPEQRDRAMQRMQIANMLIDEAKRAGPSRRR